MSTRSVHIHAPPDQVWAVLADGWLYPLFVVGAARMREVDAGWPARGTRLHHSVGSWPMMLNDTTEVLESEPTHLLRLKAHGWPGGAAEVELRLRPEGAATRVIITEDVVSGPAVLVPRVLRQPSISWRNTETLRRLALLVEGRTGNDPT